MSGEPAASRRWGATVANRPEHTGEWRVFQLAGMRAAICPANLRDMALWCLIVDDNPDFVGPARLLLERQGLGRVTVASTGEDTLRHIEERRPNVVLVAVDVGEDNGFDFVRSLRDRLGPATPDLILISIDSDQDLAELIAESPALGFISKAHLSAHAIRALLDGKTRT